MKAKSQVDKPKVLNSASLESKPVDPTDIALKPLNQLLALGEEIEKVYELAGFPSIAESALLHLEMNFRFEDFEQAMSEWLLRKSVLPQQVNLYNVFGEPSVSVFNNGKFAVDIYFWRKNDTLIHSHGFRGAFKVLYGKSLHEEFVVQTTDDLARKHTSGEKIKSDVLSSTVVRKKTEILKKGDSRKIQPAMDLVHRVLHLDDPTVTLCIRTVNDKELSQWHHLSSGISYRQCNIDELTIKRILYFQFLFESDSKFATHYLNHLLGLISTASQLALYEGLYNDEFGLQPETTFYIVEQMRFRFMDLKWFTKYEDHYQKVNKSLFEHEASSGPLKLLAHVINEDYRPDEVVNLIKDLEEKIIFPSYKNIEEGHILESLFTKKSGSIYKDLKALAQLLFNEEAIFSDEHYEHQQQIIINFAKKIVDSERLIDAGNS